MAGEWRSATLADLVDIKHGWPFKSEHFSSDRNGRPIVVAIGNFEYTGGFRFKETAVKEYLGEYPDTYQLSPGDILLVMTCQTAGGEILGIPGRIPDDQNIYLHNQRMGLVERRSTEVNLDYLYWVFLSRGFNQHLVATASGTKILHTSPGRILSYAFRLPPLDEQQAIASILGSLDDKIELNRRMNETLEEMARALFKSWFVDFDPVRAKAAGRKPSGMDAETAKLFPSAFEGSELGEIPRGWTHARVSDVCDGLFDGPHATPPEAESGAVFLGIRNFRPTSLDLSSVRHIAESDWPRWTKRVVPQHNDIVFTYEATLGFFALIPPGLRCCLGRRTALVRPRAEESDSHFLFHWFVSRPFQEFLRAHRAPGSTVDRIWLKDFPGYPVLQPPSALVSRFEKSVASLWGRIHASQAEAQTLAELRDTLLPKLLSGELSVKNAERILEATA